MRVFLGLGDPQLPFTGGADNLAQDVFELLLREDERGRIPDVIPRERHEMNLRPHVPIESVEVLYQKRLRKLARPVGAKIEK